MKNSQVRKQVFVDIDKLKFAEYNPRTITPSQYEKLKGSISEFGFVEPIVINKDYTIIGGHMRVTAYKELGGTQVPAVMLDLSKEQEMILNLALNRIAGDWDEEKLVEMLDQIKGGASFPEGSINLTGFETQEIDDLISKLLPRQAREPKDIEDIEKRAKEITKPKIHVGDILKIGRHRIICADLTVPEQLTKLMGAAKADLIVSRLPDKSDDMDYRRYLELFRQTFFNCYAVMNKNRYACINVGTDTKTNLSAHIAMIMEGIGYDYFRHIYWVRSLGEKNKEIKIRYPFPRFYKPKDRVSKLTVYVNEVGGGMPEEAQTMIVYDKNFGMFETQTTTKIPLELLTSYIGNVWYFNSEQKTVLGEPTGLVKNCIMFFTLENENVLDPYMGAGTSLLMAETNKRTAFGAEARPEYCQIIAERYIMSTGSKDIMITRDKEQISWEKLK